MCGPSSPKENDDYRAKDDARVLTDAEAIRSDSQRHAKARKHLHHAVAALGKAPGKTQRSRKRRRGSVRS